MPRNKTVDRVVSTVLAVCTFGAIGGVLAYQNVSQAAPEDAEAEQVRDPVAEANWENQQRLRAWESELSDYELDLLIAADELNSEADRLRKAAKKYGDKGVAPVDVVVPELGDLSADLLLVEPQYGVFPDGYSKWS